MSTSYLAERVVVVTGAAGGFGQRICRLAAARGAKVVASDLDAETLRETLSELGEDHSAVIGADVTRLDQLQDVARLTVERFGQLDVWINNAGTMPLAFFADHEQAAHAWSRCIDVNIKGVLNGMIAAYDPMIAGGRGHVVNVSSIYGNFPVVGAAVYGATKAAVNTLSESFRVETQGRIKVTVVKPTGVPATGLSSGVINPAAVVGILGQNAPEYLAALQGAAGGDASAVDLDTESMGYAVLDPDHIAEAIVHAIDQPWGVSIGDVTIRASGDRYIL